MIFSLKVGNTDWTDAVDWSQFQFTWRLGIGVTASIFIDATGLVDTAPGPNDRFTLVFPTGERFLLVPVTQPETLFRSDGTATYIIGYTYKLIDVFTALDRIPLPNQTFISSTSGEILRTLIPLIDPTLDVSGIANGNVVPYLATNDPNTPVSKISEVLRQQNVGAGDYIAQIDPNTNNGLAVRADFRVNFGDSGLMVDRNSRDFTPTKEDIKPEQQIVNYQRVRGIKTGGPDHTVCEFIEIDALQPKFDLGAIPYGLVGDQLMNFQINQINVAAAQPLPTDTTSLPQVLPLHYPVQIYVASIGLGSGAELFAFQGHGGATVLSVLCGPNYIGANVNGGGATASTPFNPVGKPPDLTHQYWYDWYAKFTSSGLEIIVVESYLNAQAGNDILGTISSINGNQLGITLATGVNQSDVPGELRIIAGTDTTNVRGFVSIKNYSGGVITVSPTPSQVSVGDSICSADSARTWVTEKTIYSGAGPSSLYGHPVLVVSGGSDVSARAWTASYGPAVDAYLLPNTYTGALGRRLHVDVIAGISTDLVISQSGNKASVQLVGDRLPLRGDIQMILNYDAAKQADVVVQNQASQAIFGIRQGSIIESQYAVTASECQALGNAVLADYANPFPTGTIKRESVLTSKLPIPGSTATIQVPTQYRIVDAAVPINELTVKWLGFDSDLQEIVLEYNITLGNRNSIDLVNRQLMADLSSNGIAYRPLLASGPRIGSASWNDVDTVTLGISAGQILLNGKAASASFNPINYISSAGQTFRDGPVRLAGTADTGELYVQIIYPPLQIDVNSARDTYSAFSNTITYAWADPPGAKEYHVQRLLPSNPTDPTSALTFQQVGDILNSQYILPYEPSSKSIQLQVLGLADKLGGPYVKLDATLSQMPAPTPFNVLVPTNVKGKTVFQVGGPPGGANLNRASLLRILMTKTPANNPATQRSDFSASDPNLEVFEYNVAGQPAGPSNLTHYKTRYDASQPGDMVWVTAVWVDIFGEESAIVTPFDAAHPPVSIGFIQASDFFQSAPQNQGGVIEDDDESTGQIEFSGKFRYHLGNNNATVRLYFERSQATRDNSIGTFPNPPLPYLKSAKQEVLDTDVANGYVDIDMKQEFGWSRKKIRTYRPVTVVVQGPLEYTRTDSSGNAQATHEIRILEGYVPPSPPPTLVPHQVDGVFDQTQFQFQPGIAPLANAFDNVTNLVANPTIDGLKVKWALPDNFAITRVVCLLSTANFGTKGPGADSSIGTALDGIAGVGSVTLYDPTNTNKNVSAVAIDLGVVHKHIFQIGDVEGSITISQGQTYYVGILCQAASGQWSASIVTPQSANSGTGQLTPPPPAPATPVSADVTSAIDPKTASPAVLVTFTVRTANGRPFNDPTNNTLEAYVIVYDGGQKLHPIGGPIADLTQSTTTIQGTFPLGKTLIWHFAMLGNQGGTNKSLDGNVTFVVGGIISTLAASLTATQINFAHVRTQLSFTQPSTVVPVTELREYQSLDGTNFDQFRTTLLGDPSYNTPGVWIVPMKFHTPGGTVTYYYAELVLGDGSVERVPSSGNISSTGQQAPPADQSAPGQPPAPLLTEYIGSVLVTGLLPATGANNVTQWQLACTDINTPPTTDDPPLPPNGANVFKFKQNEAGASTFNVPGLQSGTIRYFWTRCQNANFPGTWSPWSSSSNVNGTQSVVTALVGTSPPVLATNDGSVQWNAATRGFPSVQNVANNVATIGDLEPMRIWLDDLNNIVVEFILPTITSAFSLKGIYVEVYKANGTTNPLRYKLTLDPTQTTTFTFPAFQSAFAAIRYRLRNDYRDSSGTDAGNGFSPWTNYGQGQAQNSGTTYAPTTDPSLLTTPPNTDFRSLASRPNIYQGVL